MSLAANSSNHRTPGYAASGSTMGQSTVGLSIEDGESATTPLYVGESAIFGFDFPDSLEAKAARLLVFGSSLPPDAVPDFGEAVWPETGEWKPVYKLVDGVPEQVEVPVMAGGIVSLASPLETLGCPWLTFVVVDDTGDPVEQTADREVKVNVRKV